MPVQGPGREQTCVSNSNLVQQTHLEGFLNTDCWAPPPEFLIQQGLRICFSNTLPGDTDATGPRTTLLTNLTLGLGEVLKSKEAEGT